MEMHTSRPRRTREQIDAEPYTCTACGWLGANRERIWVKRRGYHNSGYVCPACHEPATERVEQDKTGDEK